MKNIAKLLCSIAVITFLLLLPDTIFSFVNPNLAVCANTDKIGVMALLALCLTFVSNKKFLIAFIAFFGLLQDDLCHDQQFPFRRRKDDRCRP